MATNKLINLAEKNEVRIDNHAAYQQKPSFYYDSLRQAFVHYFNTFRTYNATYESYVYSTSSTKKTRLKILETQFLDAENTVFSIISFQRFFELLLKDLLRMTNPRLAQTGLRKTKTDPTLHLINSIVNKTFQPKKQGGKIHAIPFRETINRFYDLIQLSTDATHGNHPIVKKFMRSTKEYTFLYTPSCREVFDFLNWYRDWILHKGNKLPSLRFLDHVVSHRIAPIVAELRKIKRNENPDWWDFFETVTGHDILAKLTQTIFEFRNTKTGRRINKAVKDYLYLGHLKELGRANQNMNFRVRRNLATYEYNYTDPVGRGIRCANAEIGNHPDAVVTKECPCCGKNSLVLYRLQKHPGIEWIKCYVCDYHIRYNVFDPYFFDLSNEPLFGS